MMAVRYKLHISSIHEMVKQREKPGFYLLGKNLVRNVDIMGTVICITENKRNPSNEFIVLKVDDGTGVIDCVSSLRKKEHINMSEMEMKEETRMLWRNLQRMTSPIPLKIGDTVHLQGFVSEFRDKKEIKTKKLRLITNVNDESHRIFELEALYRDIYDIYIK